MGTQRQDGSIQSANLPVYNKMAKTKVDKDYGIYRCMITRVHFTDSQDNLTFENKQVSYEAVILGGAKEGQVLQNVKAMNEYGGEYNYAEKIYRPVETKNLKDKRISEQKGDIVYVGFLQGNSRAPVILGGGVQPFDLDSTGATEADGFRMRKEYNGVFEEINKSGEWELKRKGGSLDATTGVLIPGEDFEARLKLFNNKMVWEDPNSSITFEKAEERWTHKVSAENYSEIIDGLNKKVVRTIGNISVVEDGAAKKITTTIGNTIVEIDGTTNKITLTAGSTIIEIDSSTGKIKLMSDFVDIGAAVSDFAVLFTELATGFNTHIHMVPQAPSGTLPSNPPLAPLLQTVSSTTVKLQP
jgi:hypothetical protein